MRQLATGAVYGAVIMMFFACTTIKQPTGAELVSCTSDSQCILVKHSHCCGATKMAINKAYHEAYLKTPAMQKTDDPETCALIGLCMDDSTVTQAACFQGECGLLWPK